MAEVTAVADGSVLTSAIWDEVRNKVVVPCLSSGRPAGVEGRRIYETDTDREWVYNNSAWVLAGWGTAAARPGVLLTDAAQSIGTASLTDITWGTEVSDVDGWTSGGSATLTVPTGWDGQYSITFSGVWGSTSLGTVPQLVILVAGAAAGGAGGLVASGVHSCTITRTLAATDTVKCQVYQNSGGNVDFTGRLEIVWLGR